MGYPCRCLSVAYVFLYMAEMPSSRVQITKIRKNPETAIRSDERMNFEATDMPSLQNNVVIISWNLTFRNFNSGELQCRNLYIPQPSLSRFSVPGEPGGPYGSATGPLSHAGGSPVIFQRQPRGNATGPLRQNKSRQKVAHFSSYCCNALCLR